MVTSATRRGGREREREKGWSKPAVGRTEPSAIVAESGRFERAKLGTLNDELVRLIALGSVVGWTKRGAGRLRDYYLCSRIKKRKRARIKGDPG